MSVVFETINLLSIFVVRRITREPQKCYQEQGKTPGKVVWDHDMHY